MNSCNFARQRKQQFSKQSLHCIAPETPASFEMQAFLNVLRTRPRCRSLWEDFFCLKIGRSVLTTKHNDAENLSGSINTVYLLHINQNIWKRNQRPHMQQELADHGSGMGITL